MRIVMWGLLVLLGVFVMSIVLMFSAMAGRFVKKEEPDELGDDLAPHMTIVMPEGEGPFPVVLQFHGCGGLVTADGGRQPIMDEYAKSLAKRGIASVSVESFPHRRINRSEALNRVCSGRRFRGAERAGDVLASIDHVRDLPWVDSDRIGLAGWSHGGWAIMDLLSMDLIKTIPHNLSSVPADKLDGVEAVHLTYPWSGAIIARTPNAGWSYTPRTRVVMAENDSVAPNVGTWQAIERMRNSGAPVEVRVFDNMDHAFDERFQEPGSHLKFNEKQAAIARSEYAEWFAKVL